MIPAHDDRRWTGPVTPREFLASYVQTAVVGFHGWRIVRVTVHGWGVAIEPRWRFLELIGAPRFQIRWEDVGELQRLVRIRRSVGVRFVLRRRGALKEPGGLTRLDQPMTRRVMLFMRDETDRFVLSLPEGISRRDKRELLPTSWFFWLTGIGTLLAALGFVYGQSAAVLVGLVLAVFCLTVAFLQASWLSAPTAPPR